MNSINSSHIIDGSILTADISNNAITNAKIADFSITNSKLDDNSIDSRKIIAGSIFGTDIAINQIGVSHLTGLAYLDLITTQAPDSINSSHIVDGSITGSDIAGTTITGANIANATITYAKLNADVTSLITNSNLSRNFINQTAFITDNILIPVDLVNNDYVDVTVTFRLSGFSNRLWCWFYAGSSYYNFKWFDGEYLLNQTNAPWIRQYYAMPGYTGMLAFDLEAAPYWRSTNVTLRIYSGRGVETAPDPRLYNVEGECRWGLAGYGPARSRITGQIEYRPTHVYLHGPTFVARYSVTNYK